MPRVRRASNRHSPAAPAAAAEDLSPEPKGEARVELYLGNGDDFYFPGASQAVIAGRPLEVHYNRNLPTGEPLASAQLCYRIDGHTYPAIDLPVRNGRLHGSAATVPVPDAAKGGIELWYKFETASGQTA